MSLSEYGRKRSFEKTPEPPAAGAAAAGFRYCIQRHDATRLHYDFRLEIDGALASWAVPQGPSLNPADKRLAVHVEDHPIAYGDFEGNIPKGNYGAGSVMLWDTGTYEPLYDTPAKEQIERGDFKFRLHGEKLRGEFAIVRMKKRPNVKQEEWLLIKKKDEAVDLAWKIDDHAYSVVTGRTQDEIAAGMPARTMPAGAVERTVPEPIEPMKAQLVDTLPKSGDWLYEIKWDGIRALCYFDKKNGLRIYTRNGNRCERNYPELAVLPQQFAAESAVLDGEIAVLDDAGRPSFSLIQPRIMANVASERPAVLFVFDLISLNGFDLRGVPLAARKELLRRSLKPHPLVRISEHFVDGEALFDAAREQGLEGIVGKRVDSTYEDRRSSAWIKRKTHKQDEFVICGYTEDKREHFGSLALGWFPNGPVMEYAGNVGTGLTERAVKDLFDRLQPLKSAQNPFLPPPSMLKKTVFVRPELIVSVSYHSWTHENHLRAPVFQGLRPDLSVRDLMPSEPEVPVSRRESALPPDKKEATVAIGSARLKFTNLDKVFWPEDGYTKRDLIDYYDAVAEFVLPHLKDRPLSLRRYPNGIHGGHFFQKDSPEHMPTWLRFEEIEGLRYVFADDRASLLYLAQLACIDQNPWMSRSGQLDQPDWVLIDLDPYECSYDRIVEAAQLVRATLDKIGLTGYAKTTGGDGMHVYIPVGAGYTYEQTKSFAEILGALAAGERPDLFTTPRAVSKRVAGRVYFDHLQNGMGKTISAPYVPRAYAGAAVSTPLEWSEVTAGLRPGQFDIRNGPERFERVGDLFRGVLEGGQELEGALERLMGLVRGK